MSNGQTAVGDLRSAGVEMKLDNTHIELPFHLRVTTSQTGRTVYNKIRRCFEASEPVGDAWLQMRCQDLRLFSGTEHMGVKL